MLILASRSPRRCDLLRQAGYDFQVIPADEEAEDQRKPCESPSDLVQRLAEQKAKNVAAKIVEMQTCTTNPQRDEYSCTTKLRWDDTIVVLGCDTVVSLGGTIFGKPSDRENAGEILRALSGRKHTVLTGVALMTLPTGNLVSDFACTELFMKNLTDAQIEEYLDTGLWNGKAGAFGYQDRNDWLQIIDGSESNVVGLPLELLHNILRST